MKRPLTLRLRIRLLTLVACETVLIVVAVIAAAYLRLGDDAWELLALETGLFKALLIAGVTQICLFCAGLYSLRFLSDRQAFLVSILNALAAASLVLAAIYYWVPDLIIGRGVFLPAAAFVITFVIGWRVMFEWAVEGGRAEQGPRTGVM